MKWKTKRLGDICRIDKKKYNGSHLAYVGLEDIESNTGAFLGSQKPKSVKSSTFEFTSKHLLYGRLRPYLNKAMLPDFHGHCSSEIFPICVSSELDRSFLFYWLTHIPTVNKINDTCTGTRMPRANIKEVLKISLFVPPLEEQKRIVEILDEAFKRIALAEANTKKNLANARELFDSYLNKVFTEKDNDWVEKNLKDIAIEFGRGKSKHRPRNDKKLYSGKHPFIQTGDIRNANHIVKKYSQTYNETGLAQSKLWKKGTVCITIAANIAETAVLDFDACIPDSIIGIHVDETKAHNIFVEYMLQSFKLLLQTKGKGSAQDNINMGTFKNQTFPFPDVNSQKKIANNLDNLSKEVQKLEFIYQRKLEALAELKQSILQKAFTGKLT